MLPSTDALACPEPMRATLCAAIAEPMTVVVDAADLGKLGIAEGENAEINGHRIRVIAVGQGLRSIGSAYVFTSQQTARALALPGDNRNEISFVLLKLLPGVGLESIRKDLQDGLGSKAYRVWTRQGLSQSSQFYWLEESGVGAGFLFSCLLGLVIGVVITSQTLRAAVLGSIREYAAFRAMGVPARKLAGVVLQQSLWIAGAGIALTLLISVLIKGMAAFWDVPLKLTGWAMLAAALIGLVTAVVSGLMALRELYRLDPAELLR
jgi:putative ABC transport system permease protein